MGSVTSKILTATTMPLLVLRTGSLDPLALRETLERVIVPLDGSEAAEAVLPSVAVLAKTIDLEVVLVRVTPSGGDYLRYMEYHHELGPGSTLARVYEGPFEEYSKESEAKAMEYLRKITADLEGQGVKKVQQKLLHGDAAEAISAEAADMEHNPGGDDYARSLRHRPLGPGECGGQGCAGVRRPGVARPKPAAELARV